ncbi:MAG: hypothetical protein BWX79_00357 [Alphaproteobacteria bacterium ADurb.Bin100]|nr:MAG: hypothetical protein BWX79_00357 [Alphaproteobacteria bacterium ADurb.Bin100]
MRRRYLCGPERPAPCPPAGRFTRPRQRGQWRSCAQFTLCHETKHACLPDDSTPDHHGRAGAWRAVSRGLRDRRGWPRPGTVQRARRVRAHHRPHQRPPFPARRLRRHRAGARRRSDAGGTRRLCAPDFTVQVGRGHAQPAQAARRRRDDRLAVLHLLQGQGRRADDEHHLLRRLHPRQPRVRRWRCHVEGLSGRAGAGPLPDPHAVGQHRAPAWHPAGAGRRQALPAAVHRERHRRRARGPRGHHHCRQDAGLLAPPGQHPVLR